MIVILTGPIQSGKTTSLINWASKKNDVYGIVTPIVNGKRVFMDVNTKEQFPMEAVGDELVLEVGRFRFSKSNFEKAISVISNAADKEGWLIIDEIGPLELRGEGFDDVLKEVLLNRKQKILLLVREGLTENVADRYAIKPKLIDRIENII